MALLDAAPEARVIEWLSTLTEEVANTSVTLAELLAGVWRLPEGRPETELAKHIESSLVPHRGTRSVLSFNEEAAGGPISTADAQIAAICLAQRATCTTRNVRDFAHTGLNTVNPWGTDG